VLLEVLEQGLEQAVGEPLAVGEVHVLEHALEARVRVFNRAERGVEGGADVHRLLAHVGPEAALGDVEAVLLGVGGEGLVVVLGEAVLVLLHPHVAEALVEEEAEDVVLEVARVDGAPEQVGGSPQVTFEVGQGQGRHRVRLQARSGVPTGDLVGGPEVRGRVVPAFKDSSGRGYLIPDRDAASWIRTDPRKHAEYATQANTRAGNKAKPIIKALKSWNAQQNKVVRSFHLELMVYDVLQSDPGNYAGGIAQALRGLASRVRYPMPEPARVGPDVDQGMSQAERDRARAAFSEAADLADKATAAADRLATSEAHYHWRQLLGPTYPEPGTAPRKPGTASSHADGNAPDPGSRRFG
jgi:hypothetical protein